MKSNAVLVCAALFIFALGLSAPARAGVQGVTATTTSMQFPSLTLNGTATQTVMFYNPGPTVTAGAPISLCVTAGSGCTTADFSADVSGSETMSYGDYSGGPCNSSITELASGTLCWVSITYTQTTFQPANATLEVTGFIGSFNVALNASPAIGDVSATQMFLQTTNEDEPNAYPEGSAPDGLYGDSSTESCNSSSDAPENPCWNPLEIEFDASQIYTSTTTPTPAVLASLTEPYQPSLNLLANTNSIGSTDGGVASISASFGCNSGYLTGSIVATNEDGSVFTFTVEPSQVCSPFPQSLSLSFTSTGGSSDGDSGYATLYSYANSTLSGTYTGTWDDATTGDSPLSKSGTGSSSIDVSIADDFTTTATAVMPAGSFGSCQAQAETFTTSQAVSLGQGITSTVGGYSTGGDVLLTAADSDGDVLWLIGSTTDGSGNMLPSGELFFSAYVATAGSGLSSCPGSIIWDAPFQKKHATFSPIHHPRKHVRMRLPRKWQARGAFDRTVYRPGGRDDRNGWGRY
ncbi:MAG TPA: hypothetical protein VMB47_11690 [Candidatus Aquilonibacter sp.]|nr:hypothetical protein [Candidatus Aquilonibacter sp.]